MYIIIIGCGKLGCVLANELSDAGHNVSVVDREAKKLEELGNGFNGITVKGIEYDYGILKDAGIGRADYLIASASDDNLNITVSLVAKNIFSVPHVIAMVNNPNKKSVYKILEIEAINPTELISYVLRSKIERETK
ncbi:MAG: TrkA family potassium uptake protein [Clostridiales bacterium]|nr:TrkA family potassium uptake protein [Clostridiales bacterium]